MHIRSYLHLPVGNTHFNKVVEILTYSDSFLWGGHTMVNTLVAVYLSEKIAVDPLPIIASGFSIYFVARSIVQIPIAQFLDSRKGYFDEAIAIFISAILIGTSLILYLFVSEPWHLYAVQILFGIGIATNLPAWRKTFARFVDRGHEGVEYSVYDIICSLSIAVFTALGGYIVDFTGTFTYLFITAGVLVYIGGIIALLLLKIDRLQHSR